MHISIAISHEKGMIKHYYQKLLFVTVTRHCREIDICQQADTVLQESAHLSLFLFSPIAYFFNCDVANYPINIRVNMLFSPWSSHAGLVVKLNVQVQRATTATSVFFF